MLTFANLRNFLTLRADKIRKLNISHRDSEGSAAIEIAETTNLNLTELHISRLSLSPTGFAGVLCNQQKLEILVATQCVPFNHTIFAYPFNYISAKHIFKTIQILDLGDSYLTAKGLLAVGKMPKLKDLRLEHIRFLPDWHAAAALKFAEQNMLLDDDDAIDDELDIGDTPESFEEILVKTFSFNEIRGLTSLRLASQDITDAVVLSITNNLLSLRHLELSSPVDPVITDKGVISICQKLKRLRSLALPAECEMVTDSGFRNLLRTLTCLTRLDVSFTNITDDTLCNEIFNFTELTSLDLRGCQHITGIGLRAAALNVPALQTLDISFWELITDDSLIPVFDSLPRLTTLYLRSCCKLTDQTLLALSRATPNLHTVDFDGCNLFTRAGMQNLRGKLKKLRYVRESDGTVVSTGYDQEAY